jgi:hypothetical protein
MKIKKVNVEYYTMRHDFNSKKIVRENIIGSSLIEDIAKEVKKGKITNLKELEEYLKRKFMYHYWCKSEFEIGVGGLFSKYPEEFEKIDGWFQIEKNLPMITKSINTEMELRFKLT